MARILYFSDIHIESRARQATYQAPGGTGWTNFYPLCLGPDVSTWIGGAVDLAVLAGDIGLGDQTSDVSALLYAEQLAFFLDAPVVFVPGNHSYYGTEFHTARQQLLSARRRGVTVLDRKAARFDIAGIPLGEPVRVLGATLWTDYSVLGDKEAAMERARHGLNDHRLISMPGNRAFLPADAADEHRLSRAWLAAELQAPFAGRTIVVTHHVPHPDVGNPRFPSDNPLSPAFQSDCSDLLDAARTTGVVGWIFGHHHACIDATARGVRLLSAQWGYPREETGWSGPGILAF